MPEVLTGCEICHSMYKECDLIEVKDIVYDQWKRLYPCRICQMCAEKISDALLVKVVKDVELKNIIIQAKGMDK